MRFLMDWKFYDKFMKIYVESMTSGSGANTKINLNMIKKMDPNCTRISKQLNCVKKNYDLDTLYDIALQKDFNNSDWKNYISTYPTKCQHPNSGSAANQGPSGPSESGPSESG